MGVGEEDALGGELVEPRAGDVVVPVYAEIAAEVVPMHDEQVVSPRPGHAVSFPVTTVHATGAAPVPQPFDSPEATYPQLGFYPQAGFELLVACCLSQDARVGWIRCLT